MVSQFIKALTITAGAGLLIACSTAHGVDVTSDEFNTTSSLTTIGQQANDSRTYKVDGKVIYWNDLSPEKQQKLTELHNKIEAIESKFDQFETELAPLIETIEEHAEEIEKVAELIEIKTEVFDDIDNMTLKEIQEASRKVEASVRLHERDIRALESVIREKESQVRMLESKLMGQESATMKELEGYVEQIAEILADH